MTILRDVLKIDLSGLSTWLVSGVQTLDQNSSKQAFMVEKWAEAPVMVPQRRTWGRVVAASLLDSLGRRI